jgi:SAM-dependent methyltransferase
VSDTIDVAVAVEAVKAKENWGSTDLQGKEYPARPPFYAASLVHVLRRLAPGVVLEMGCNTGRNLELMRRSLPAATSLRGFDINPTSIEYGRTKWGLDLELADEDYLGRVPADSVDMVFTVSVLDHLPAIEPVLVDLARVTRGHYISVEPYPEEDLRYLDIFQGTDGSAPRSPRRRRTRTCTRTTGWFPRPGSARSSTCRCRRTRRTGGRSTGSPCGRSRTFRSRCRGARCATS